MTKDELERIKQAYYSGLKVQIWFNGHWENFDARDYSMHSDPFSENRLYRIVGNAYADIAEKRIAELEKEISILLSCNNCPENKGGYICQKEYEDKCLAQKIQYIKELQEENAELREQIGKMKCCGNCRYFNITKDIGIGNLFCDLKLIKNEHCKDKDHWQFLRR